MPRFVDIWNAHHAAAVAAYGYFSEAGGVANVSQAFADALQTAWDGIAGTAEETSGLIPWPDADTTAYDLVEAARAHLSAAGAPANPAPLWNACFSLAVTLDQAPGIKAPSIVQSIAETVQDDAGWLNENLVKPAISAAKGFAVSTIVLVIALGIGYLYLLKGANS